VISRGAAGVWALSLGQTTGYVAQTFAFAALVVALSDPDSGAGIPRAVLAFGPTAGLLLAAVLAPFAGRLVDRGYGSRLLLAGPVLSAAGLLVAAQAHGVPAVWIAGFLLIGLGQATSQFETCFALLTRWLGPAARGAIVRVTLVGGFATTIAFPLGDALNRAFGWEGALIGLAIMQVGVTLPLNMMGTGLLGGAVVRRAEAAAGEEVSKGHLAAALQTRAFWLLAGLIALIWMNHAMLTTFALPVFMDRGADHDIAVMLAAAMGPAQVAGRLMLVLAGDRLPLQGLTQWVLAGFVLAAAMLAGGQGVPTLWLLFALTQGAAAGIITILRPLLAADVLGRAGFGAIWGALSVAPLLAYAVAPLLGALLLQRGGPGAVMAAALAMAMVAAGLGLALRDRISQA
jgi:MFS family permease